MLSPGPEKCKYVSLVLFFGILRVVADPAITGYTGTIADGGNITITGDGFGAKATAAPIKYDDFENGANDTALYSRDTSWHKYGNGANYSNAASHSGKLSVSSVITDGESFNTNYFLCGQPSDEIFISYWWRTINADTGDKTIVKLTRICSSEAAGGGGVYNGAGNTTLGGTFNFASEDGPYCAYNNGETAESVLHYFSFPKFNTWLKIEMYKKLGAPGVKNGIVECNLLGVDYAIATAALTRAQGHSFKLNSVLLGLMDGNASKHDYRAFIDDMYIDTTRARIEIGNARTWSACTVREVQLPTVWTDTLLECSVNLGLFTASENLYLFVVDANGKVNTTGYPLSPVAAAFVPLSKQNDVWRLCGISCFRKGVGTMNLSVSLAEKKDLSLSVFDISGRKLWAGNISGFSKRDFILPLPATPFIVFASQKQGSYSKLFFLL